MVPMSIFFFSVSISCFNFSVFPSHASPFPPSTLLVVCCSMSRVFANTTLIVLTALTLHVCGIPWQCLLKCFDLRDGLKRKIKWKKEGGKGTKTCLPFPSPSLSPSYLCPSRPSPPLLLSPPPTHSWWWVTDSSTWKETFVYKQLKFLSLSYI